MKLVRRRDYCRCVEVRNFSPEEAADRLKCRVRFLTDNVKSLPHQKLGQAVAFCNCELLLIQAMFSELPPEVLAEAFGGEPDQQPATGDESLPSLASIKPATRPNRAVAV